MASFRDKHSNYDDAVKKQKLVPPLMHPADAESNRSTSQSKTDLRANDLCTWHNEENWMR